MSIKFELLFELLFRLYILQKREHTGSQITTHHFRSTARELIRSGAMLEIIGDGRDVNLIFDQWLHEDGNLEDFTLTRLDEGLANLKEGDIVDMHGNWDIQRGAQYSD
ncbi:hypothetical protein RJT34_30315 [Clitoria ternatea]|uniref:Uncharacterized protein n=1 Tax=Clitoria ternatea TaxID=43366 RepID=A0AAN9I3X9_CLITE